MTKETKERIQYLLAQLVERKASKSEKQMLFEMIDERGEDEAIESIVEELITAEPEMTDYHPADWEPVILSILKKKQPRGGVVRSMRKWRWIAAAAIIGFVVWGLWFVVGRPFDEAQGDSLRQAQTDINDVKAPEVNRAMIELSDGSVVYLDSAGIGSLADVSGVKVMKMADGKIVYQSESSSVNREIVYNTLTNPRGSNVIDITLSDGSRLWLNAGSSLRYPVVFGGDKREVELSGEGYFEVNTVNRESSIVNRSSPGSGGPKGAKIPFFVRSGEVVTEVLGTHFNVNAYEDEGEIKVTLLEGRVNVKREGVNRESVKLVPGQQATLRQVQRDNVNLSVVSGVDVEQVMAWKNGYFSFNNADLRSILRQASRWYDVDVSFEQGVPTVQFSGKIGRGLSLKEFLSILDDTRIRYRIEGKRLVITR